MSAYPREAQPRSIYVPGESSDSLTFTLPDGVVLELESVAAQIDASGGAADLELVISTPDGQVITAKRQSEPIAAGQAGTASWSLRLDSGGGSAPATGLELADNGAGTVVTAGSVGAITLTATLGDPLIDLSPFPFIAVNESGIYAITASFQWVWNGVALTGGRFLQNSIGINTAVAFEIVQQSTLSRVSAGGSVGDNAITVVAAMNAGQLFVLNYEQRETVSLKLRVLLTVQRLG